MGSLRLHYGSVFWTALWGVVFILVSKWKNAKKILLVPLYRGKCSDNDHGTAFGIDFRGSWFTLLVEVAPTASPA